MPEQLQWTRHSRSCIESIWYAETRVTSYDLKYKSASSNPRVPRLKLRITSSNPWVTSSNPRVMTSNSQVMSSYSQVVGSYSQVISSDPRVTNSNPQVSNSNPQVQKSFNLWKLK